MHMQINLGFVQASGSLMSFRLKQAKCSSYLPQLVCLSRCLPKHVWLLEGGRSYVSWLDDVWSLSQGLHSGFTTCFCRSCLHEDKEKARAMLPTTPCQFLEGSDALSCVGTERSHCGPLFQVGLSDPALLSHAARPACKLAEGRGFPGYLLCSRANSCKLCSLLKFPTLCTLPSPHATLPLICPFHKY